MARISLHLDSATAEQARAFIVAWQTTRHIGPPPVLFTEPTVAIMGIGWHVNTPAVCLERACAIAAKLEPAEDQDLIDLEARLS